MKLAGFLVAWVVLPLAAAEVHVDLRSRAEVSGAVLVLGDLARVESTDLQLLRMVIDLPVGRVPRPGRGHKVTVDDLRAIVDRALQGAGGTARWSGAAACDVAATRAVVSGESLARAAVQAVGTPAHAVRLPRDLPVPAGAVTLTARLAGRAAGGRQSVWIDLHSGGEWIRSVAVTVQSTGFAAPAAVAVGSVPMQSGGDRAVVHTGSAVERGRSATLRSRRGEVLAETRVEALQDGHDGDRILVRSAKVTAPLSVLVIGPDLVEVDR